MTDYKAGIIESHKRGFGSSDAKEIIKLSNNGMPSTTLLKRIHAIKNDIEREQVSTKAMRLGDEIEMRIYEMLVNNFPNDEILSNPFWVMPDVDYPFSIFCHPDQVVVNNEKVLILENKSSTKDMEHWQQEALPQVAWQYMCAKKIYPDKNVIVRLVHYDTADFEVFDSSKIQFEEYDNYYLENCISLFIDSFEYLSKNWESFEYQDGEVLDLTIVDSNHPLQLKVNKLEKAILAEKQAKADIANFREQLSENMQNVGLKKIQSEKMTITLVNETVESRLDTKRLKAERPDIAEEYTKTSIKKAHIKMSVKE